MNWTAVTQPLYGYSRTSTNSHLCTMATLFFPGGTVHTLTLIWTSLQRQRPLKRVPNCQPLDNCQFFQWLMKKSRMVMKFDTYGTLLINRCNRTFWFCFIYTVAVNINFYDTYSKCCAPCPFCHLKIWFKFCFCVVHLYYMILFWITDMRYSNHELSTISMFYSRKKKLSYYSPRPHNSHLSTKDPRWPLW